MAIIVKDTDQNFTTDVLKNDGSSLWIHVTGTFAGAVVQFNCGNGDIATLVPVDDGLFSVEGYKIADLTQVSVFSFTISGADEGVTSLTISVSNV